METKELKAKSVIKDSLETKDSPELVETKELKAKSVIKV